MTRNSIIFSSAAEGNIPFLYAQTVELSISVDKQDVLYRCSDSIKSLKSSANYMGYEKLTQHYSNWQHAIENAVEQLSSGKMPNLTFMQDYLDEIIRSFPQAMEGYSHDDADMLGDSSGEEKHDSAFIDSALNSIFADDEPVAASDGPFEINEALHEDDPSRKKGKPRALILIGHWTRSSPTSTLVLLKQEETVRVSSAWTTIFPTRMCR